MIMIVFVLMLFLIHIPYGSTVNSNLENTPFCIVSKTNDFEIMNVNNLYLQQKLLIFFFLANLASCV